jgi:hypothetical protein
LHPAPEYVAAQLIPGGHTLVASGPGGATGCSHGWSEFAPANERNPWKPIVVLSSRPGGATETPSNAFETTPYSPVTNRTTTAVHLPSAHPPTPPPSPAPSAPGKPGPETRKAPFKGRQVRRASTMCRRVRGSGRTEDLRFPRLTSWATQRCRPHGLPHARSNAPAHRAAPNFPSSTRSPATERATR